jgi:hypothetical protein
MSAQNKLQDRNPDVNKLSELSPNKHGKVYSGHSAGYNNPKLIVEIRDKKHDKTKDEQFGKACLDFFVPAFLPDKKDKSDIAYVFIVGREQFVVEKMGGEYTLTPIIKPNEKEKYLKHQIELTRSGNSIAALAKNKPLPSNLSQAYWVSLLTNAKKETYYYLCMKVYNTYEEAIKKQGIIKEPQNHLWDGVCPNK